MGRWTMSNEVNADAGRTMDELGGVGRSARCTTSSWPIFDAAAYVELR